MIRIWKLLPQGWRVVLACLLIAGLLPLHVGTADDTSTRFLRYHIDREAVPQWVKRQALTLRFDVGTGAATLRAWGDGRPLPVRYHAQDGMAVVTTSADEVVLAIQGEDLTAEGIGDCIIAPLKEDKLWAYSLTFDDGRLSVYERAYPLLQRYDYRAGVAVIGYWLDESTGEDALDFGYCSNGELLEFLDADWSIFNHSYSHYNAPSDITFEDAQRCQDLIRDELEGYEATTFTAPHVNPLWGTIIDEHAQVLGLYLLQLYADSGQPFVTVDGGISLDGGAFRLGRHDIKRWQDPNLFDQAHAYAVADTPQHRWLTLHAHEMTYDEDWCAVADSSSYLYRTYGAGGTDEVWVAPADEVFDYLVARSYATVSKGEAAPRSLGAEWPAATTMSYQEGVGGRDWQAAYIDEALPNGNHGNPGKLWMRTGEREQRSMLLQTYLAPPDEEAVVLDATLSLYALSHSNDGAMELRVYPLLRPWDPATVAWNRAAAEVAWERPGARAPQIDRSESHVASARLQGCPDSLRWYTFDITEAVGGWLADPESNYGVVIEGEGSVSKSTSFAASSYWDKTKRPKLTVHWGWCAPEPTVAPSPTPTATPTTTPSPEPTLPPTPVRICLPLIES